ncbi:MAG: hypothetical protein ACRD96_14520, partial [Bryobacteraceae bacterium]
MPRIPRGLSIVALVVAAGVVCPAVDVGTGAPTEALSAAFLRAFFRNAFPNKVTLPPLNDVTRFGSAGLIQEFRDATQSGSRHALVKANLRTNAEDLVYQVLAGMHSYYTSVGVNTAGYPVNDTQDCPAFEGNTCQYQFFSLNHVLFVYSTPTFNGQNFLIRDPFYTRWLALSGLDFVGPGRPADIERAATVGGVNATVQVYASAALYNITSGTQTGRLLAVTQP